MLERPIDKTVWWEGFEISVDALKAEPQAGSGVNVTIGVTWTNLSDASGVPAAADARLRRRGHHPLVGRGRGRRPSLGGSARSPRTSPRRPIRPRSSDELELVWGESGDNQSIVPLDEDTEPTTFEPQELAAFGGTVTTPTVVIEVSDGRYGWSYKPATRASSRSRP